MAGQQNWLSAAEGLLIAGQDLTSVPLVLNGVATTFGAVLGGAAPLDAAGLHALALSLSTTYVGVLTVAQPAAQQVFQRDTRTGGTFGLGAGALTLTLARTQPINTLDYRIRDAASPAVVLQDWASAGGSLATGTSNVTFSVPASLAWYLFDLRANTDPLSIISTTNKVAVGEVVAIAGQSLAEAFLTTAVTGDTATITSLGVTVSPFGSCLISYANNAGNYPPVADGPDVNYPPAAWVLPGNASVVNSTGAAEFLRLAVANAGVPCAIVGYSVGGTSIASWLPGYAGANPGHWTKLVANITQSGAKFGAFLWDQGHYESKDGTTSGIYLAALQSLFSAITTAFPASGAYKKIIATIPGVGNYGSGPGVIEMVRTTALQYVQGDANATYVDGMDATLAGDLVHPSQAGNIIYARHMYRAFMAAVGLRTTGDRGPIITGASRSYGSLFIDLGVSQVNGGTSLVSVGASGNQFQIFQSGSVVTPLALDATTPFDLSIPTRVRLKLAALPVEPFAHDVWYRLPPDTAAIVAAGIYDNVVDADGLAQGRQLALVTTAIVSAAPSYTITVATPAPTAPATSFTVSGTISGGGTPTSLAYSLDTGTTWTTATTPTIGASTYSFTIAAGVSVGTYSMMVRDVANTGTVGSSAVFSVAIAAPPALPVIAGPIFALDASVANSHFYQDTARTIQAVAGSTVQGVSDLTGTGNHFAKIAAKNAPTLAVNAKNSLPGLRFTGSLAQLLQSVAGAPLAGSIQTGPYTIMAIYTPATLPAVAADVFTAGNSVTGTGAQLAAVQFRATGLAYAQRTTPTATNNLTVSSAEAANLLTKQIISFDGATAQTNRVNAIAEVTGTVTGSAMVGWDNAMLGALWDTTSGYQFPLDGWIHELRIWNSAPALADRNALTTYATSKWGS